MKISINVDPGLTDTEITINCRRITEETEGIISALRMFNNQLTVVKNGETHLLDLSRIAYIEAVDRRIFVYTRDDCYESGMKLYELERMLCGEQFLRISKSCIVRLRFIRSLRAEFDRKIRITLENGEQLIASRQYADELKKRLGGGKIDGGTVFDIQIFFTGVYELRSSYRSSEYFLYAVR